MASWFRSEKMKYVQLIIPEDAAHNCVSVLGSMGVIQFTDLNTDQTAFQRRYVSYIARCDELERKLRYFKSEIEKFGISVQEIGTPEDFARSTGSREKGPKLLEVLESDLEKKEAELLELNKFSETLNIEFNQKVELHEVLRKSRHFFARDVPELRDDPRAPGGALDPFGQGIKQQPLMDADFGGRGDADMRFQYISGVLRQEDRGRFERMLFRATRGNCYARFAEIEAPIAHPPTGEMMHKMVFMVFFKSSAIEAKINKICDAFGAARYGVPPLDDAGASSRLEEETRVELKEAQKVLHKNRHARYALCCRLAQELEEWQWTVLREKSTYHTLNLFKVFNRGFLSAEGWAVADALPQVEGAVAASTRGVDTEMTTVVEDAPKPWPTPPTYFRLNKFTWAFQEFVNTYGTPRYQEANPALFTAATFPFMYGVMYGDIGHGGCVLLLGLYLLWLGNRPQGRDGGGLASLVKARYMIFLMGLYSVYCGLVYNDYFALGLDLFGSKWSVFTEDSDTSDSATNVADYGDPDSVYPFGCDPAWHVSNNELLFFNSMKMKTSVIIGIIHMTFGICLRGLNCIYFKDKIGFWLEFVPMLIFDLSMFGYMVLLIFIKWSINWEDRMLMGTCNDDGTNAYDASYSCDPDGDVASVCFLDYGGTGDGCQPPNLITTLIGIVLSPGSVEEPMFAGQASVQVIVLLIIFITVPVLLLGRPLAEKFAAKSHGHGAPRADSFASDSPLADPEANKGHGGHDEHGGGHEAHSFSEVFIHQCIETIEFVLGMVSNTASYLRLWALSLAHSELATVFWEKALLATIEMNSPIAIFFGYGIFAAVTFGVLLCMDVLECFLHALRLHWVEFQNKFYKADGYLFQPFSYADLIQKTLED
mmetsp:Transcript_15792/g.25734  ORF Transcript_15792/g.25734 Transcript_15792/m.25734 type:complete len:879 (-) Transcript_15792:45-2681(-)